MGRSIQVFLSYIFTSSKAAARAAVSRCGFGGGCVNDVVIHLATSGMGFGGAVHHRGLDLERLPAGSPAVDDFVGIQQAPEAVKVLLFDRRCVKKDASHPL